MKNHTPSKQPTRVSSQRRASLPRSHRRSGQRPRVQTRRPRRRRNPRPARKRVRYGVEGVPTQWSSTERILSTLQCGDKLFKQTASSGGRASKFKGLAARPCSGNWESKEEDDDYDAEVSPVPSPRSLSPPSPPLRAQNAGDTMMDLLKQVPPGANPVFVILMSHTRTCSGARAGAGVDWPRRFRATHGQSDQAQAHGNRVSESCPPYVLI